MTSFLAGLALQAVTRWPWLARVPWKLLGILILCAALFAAGWNVRGWKEASAQRAAIVKALELEREAYATRDREHQEQIARDALILQEALEERDRLQAELARLQSATVALPLTRTETKVIHADCSCPDTRIAPSFRVCFNAAATGDAEAIAACEAQRVPAGVPSQ